MTVKIAGLMPCDENGKDAVTPTHLMLCCGETDNIVVTPEQALWFAAALLKTVERDFGPVKFVIDR